MTVDLSLASTVIPAVVLFRGKLCCIAIDLQSQQDISFIYDLGSGKLLTNHGSALSFRSDEVCNRVRNLIMNNTTNVAVLEFASLGQVVREHEVRIRKSM